MSRKKRLSEQELDFIKVHSQDMTINEIATSLGRNYWCVQRVLQNKEGEKLTKEQMAFIDEYKSEWTIYQIANKLGVGYKEVYGYINKRVNVKQNHVFTADEDFMIRQLYGTYKASYIATKIGVDETSIYNRVKKLGLKKNKGGNTK